jgi:hypothetical protein
MVDYVHLSGVDNKISTQGIREAKTAATTVVGTIKDIGFGKKVIYSQLGAAAISAGLSVQAAAIVANHQNRLIVKTASIGEKEVVIVIGATSAAQNQYEGAILVIVCGAGTDYSYQISGHPAWAASLSAAKVLLKDGLEIALNTTSVTMIKQVISKGVVITPDCAVVSAPFVGVTLCSAAASSYVYLGYKGQWPCKVITGTVFGGAIAHGNTANTTGALGPHTLTALETVVGVCVATAAAAELAVIDFF